MFWYRFKIVAIGLAALMLALSLLKLHEAERGLKTSRVLVGGTPVIVTEPSKTNEGIIFLAHGFAGSTSFMRPLAVSLARAGYITVRFDFLGHGRHQLPYFGDITSTNGATKIFVNQAEMVVRSYMKTRGRAKGVIIGHSMASDIIFRTAAENRNLVSAIGISTYSDVITKTDPKNVLIINGLWEPQLRKKAFEILRSTGIKAPQEDFVYGSFANETARKITTIKNADHVGILYSSRTQREVLEWVASVFEEENNFSLNEIGLWVANLLLCLAVLFLIATSYLPRKRAFIFDVEAKRVIIANLLAFVLTPLIMYFYTPKILSFPSHNYLLIHLLIYSFLLGGVLGVYRNRHLLRNFNIVIFVALFVFFTLVFGTVLDRYVSSFYPTGPRVALLFIFTIGCVPIMIVIQTIYEIRNLGVIMANLSKLMLILSLLPALILNFQELFLLFYSILLLLAFFMVFGFLSNMLNRIYNNTLSVAVANGISLSWTFSTALPLYVV